MINLMKPKINKTSEYIEIVGHYDDSVLCAKLTLLTDLYAIEHRYGYAKFRIEDEDKLRFIDDRLEFYKDPEPVVYDYCLEIINENSERIGNIVSQISSESTVYFEENSSAMNNYSGHDSTVRGVYLCSGQNGYLYLEVDLSNYDGLSTTQGAVTPDIADGALLNNYFAIGQITSDENWTYNSSNTNYLYAVPKASNVLPDLTGTKWVFNNQISMSPLQGDSYTFNFDFYMTGDQTAPGGGFELIVGPDDDFELDYTNIATAYDDGVWQGEVFSSITITGGTDVTNANLIAWLQANATQIVEPTGTNTFSIGSLQVANVYFGLLQINKIYLGNSLVWESASEPTPENALLAQDGALLTSGGGYLITTEVTLISFTIEGTTYQAEQSMTWGEWVNSTYNIVNYRVQYDNIYTSTGQTRVYNGSQIVSSSDTILANTAYSLVIMGMED